MVQQVFLDVIAASLEIVGMASAQTISDSPAKTHWPTKEFRVMNVLDVMHGQHRGLADVETGQCHGRRIDDVRFRIHLFSDLLEYRVAGELIEIAAGGKKRGSADFAPK